MNPVAETHRILDVRAISPGDRDAGIFSAFDALAPGEAFVLVSAQDPRPLLEAFKVERKGLFEWSPAAEDTQVWHIEITRRHAKPGALRRVTEALAWDHDRLDALETLAFTALQDGDLDGARRLYAAFHHGLNRHIRFEEELLFPVFEARTGLPHAGPTAVMRAEHREIRMILENMAWGLEGPASAIEELRRALHRVLGDHNRKEEDILYPAADRLMSEAESDLLVGRIQAFPS